MRKPLILLLLLAAAGAVAALAVALMLQRKPEPEWTTDSPRALEEYEEALSAWKKRYHNDMVTHLRRALELDPDFAMAKLQLSQAVDADLLDLRDDLRSVDFDRLTPREATMIRYHLAHRDGEHAEAEAMLARYVADHPEDPYTLYMSCSSTWVRLQWDEAEACYERLLARHPNWVEAQNHIGYLSMGRGDFAQAEEHFRTYRFIAPDQANPHDSLGELYMSVGRYDEAEKAFQEALAQKPDFCAALAHMTQARALSGRFDAARDSFARLRETPVCQEKVEEGQGCWMSILIDFLEGGYETAWETAEGCRETAAWSVLPHRAALLTGRGDEAAALDTELETALETHRNMLAPLYFRNVQASLLNRSGSRLVAAGAPEEAIDLLRKADELSGYYGDFQLTFKLFNRLDLAVALEAAGRSDEAETLRQEIRAVNPLFEQAFADGARGLLTAPATHPLDASPTTD